MVSLSNQLRMEGVEGEGDAVPSVGELVLDDGVEDGVAADAGVAQDEGEDERVGAGGARGAGHEGQRVLSGGGAEGGFLTEVDGVGKDKDGVVEPAADVVAGSGGDGVGRVFGGDDAAVVKSQEIGAVVEDIEGVEGEACQGVLWRGWDSQEREMDGSVVGVGEAAVEKAVGGEYRCQVLRGGEKGVGMAVGVPFILESVGGGVEDGVLAADGGDLLVEALEMDVGIAVLAVVGERTFLGNC